VQSQPLVFGLKTTCLPSHSSTHSLFLLRTVPALQAVSQDFVLIFHSVPSAHLFWHSFVSTSSFCDSEQCLKHYFLSASHLSPSGHISLHFFVTSKAQFTLHTHFLALLSQTKCKSVSQIDLQIFPVGS